MNYGESVNFLDKIGKTGSSYGLNSIRLLLHQLGNPQEQLKVIHIAGTNGKGSVSNILTHILIESNFQVGLFNSPNILSYTETITINQSHISEEDFAKTTSQIKTACVELVAIGHPHPTVFECFTAIALVYFAVKNVDFAIIEVGLGGALDSTNVFNAPLASVITSISFDHMDLLGHTLEAITTAKAGIIKQNSPVIIAPNPKEVLGVLFEQCQSQNATIFYVPESEIHLTIHQESLEGIDFSIITPYFCYNALHTKLIGAHQLTNISVALTTIEVLRNHWHYKILEDSVRRGLDNTYWPCRCEYLDQPVQMLIDGAHNEASLDGLMGVLEKYCKNRPITFLFGVLKDKDVTTMLNKMSHYSETIFITKPLSPRALSLSILQEESLKSFKQVFSFENPYEALEEAVLYVKKTNTFLCCVGSLYLSIPLRTYIRENQL